MDFKKLMENLERLEVIEMQNVGITIGYYENDFVIYVYELEDLKADYDIIEKVRDKYCVLNHTVYGLGFVFFYRKVKNEDRLKIRKFFEKYSKHPDDFMRALDFAINVIKKSKVNLAKGGGYYEGSC